MKVGQLNYTMAVQNHYHQPVAFTLINTGTIIHRHFYISQKNYRILGKFLAHSFIMNSKIGTKCFPKIRYDLKYS